jgi:hypothetical protein
MFVTKVESDGAFWPLIHNCVLFALGFGNLMLLCVVWIQGSWQIAMGVVPLPICVIGYKIWSAVKMNPRFFYFIPDEREREQMKFQIPADDGVTMTALEDRYENPAISKPLLVPLVDAKARELLPEILATGGLSGDQLLAEEDFDITRGNGLDMVDFVEENQMNYSYYQHLMEDTHYGNQARHISKEANYETSEYGPSSYNGADDVQSYKGWNSSQPYSKNYKIPYARSNSLADPDTQLQNGSVSQAELSLPVVPRTYSRRSSSNSLYPPSMLSYEIGVGVAPHPYGSAPDEDDDNTTLLHPQPGWTRHQNTYQPR